MDHGIEVEHAMQPVDIQILEDVDEMSGSSSYPMKVGANPIAHTGL